MTVFGTREHHDIGWRRLGNQRSLPRRSANGRLFNEANNRHGEPAKVAPLVRFYRTEKVLECFLGKVWFLDHALRWSGSTQSNVLLRTYLRGVDKGKIQCRTRVTGIKNRRQPNPRLQGFDPASG